MSYQFIHVECYARKGSQQAGKPPKMSAREVAAEAERQPGNCPHVHSPRPPVVLHGTTPRDALADAEAWANQAKDAQGRKLRQDGHCLLAGVVSMPAERADEWPAFRAAAVEWLRREYGERLRCAVEHTDEPHPHLHFYAVPLPGERFEVLHAGQRAAKAAASAGMVKGKQNSEYIAAMRGWQDRFHSEVSAEHGLLRLGPARQRLSRAEWQAQKAQAKALAAPVRDITITSKDVTKRVTKTGFLGSQYESGEELAVRLTDLARKQAVPLAYRASLAQRRGESENRLQATLRAENEANERLAKLRGQVAEMERYAEGMDRRITAQQEQYRQLDADIDRLREMRNHESGLDRI